jgi:RecA/RadA recombinase
MAKKTSLNQFSDISGLLESASDKTDVILENSNIQNTYISTDVHILDALLSTHVIDGGVADDRITVFAGDPQTGKSYICYNIARNAQKQGYYVIFIDTEHACTLSTFETFGVDVKKENFQLIRIKDVDTIKTVMAKFLNNMRKKKEEGFELRKTIIFFDSIGGVASRKEIDDAIEGKNKQDMTRAKSLKQLFRIISVEMGFLRMPLVATNHIYLSQDLFPQAIMNGGKGLEYSASVIVYLTSAKLKSEREDDMSIGQTGIVVSAKAKKNRMAKLKKIKFDIDGDGGTNKYGGLDFFCNAENFEKIGIARGKMIKNKDGVLEFEAGGQRSKWYVRHLDQTFYDKDLYTTKVFTKDILEKLEPIVKDYFRYASYEEAQQYQEQSLEQHHKAESNVIDEIDDTFDIDVDGSENKLFD